MKMYAGIYIHIPFCRSRCSYCDFATGMYESELAARYVHAVVSEIAAWREVEEPSDVDTISQHVVPEGPATSRQPPSH